MFFLKMLNVNKDLLMEQILSRDKYDPVSLNAICFLEESLSKKQIWMNVNACGVLFYILVVFYIVCAIVKELGKIVCRFPIRCWFKRYRYFSERLEGKIVFVVPPLNDYRSLERVIDIVSENETNVLILDKKEYYNAFPRLLILVKSFFSIFQLLHNVSSLPSDMRYIAYKHIDALFLSSGFTYCARKVFEKSSPECIVFANDHSYDRKSLILLSEDLGFKTIYIQHASISSAFPELRTTYSFLDGMDVLEKYTSDEKKIYSKIILIGAVRYDGLRLYSINRKCYKRDCIGIAVNDLDDAISVKKLYDYLLKHLVNLKIKIRLHPAMKKSLYDFCCGKDRIVCISAEDEDVRAYLDSIDLQLAGDSGIHLDAVFGGVPTFVYNFSNSKYVDSYDYVKNGLIEIVDSFEKVENLITNQRINRPDSRSIRLYDESYGKTYMGHCSEIVANFIKNGCNFNLFEKENNLVQISYKKSCYYIINDDNIE